MSKYARQRYESFVMLITPAIAREMLATSPGNRRIRAWAVDDYVRMMPSWLTTNQSIGFDRGGHLGDGHHRLMAIVKSGVTVSMPVTLGLESNSFDHVDQGIPRSTADTMSLQTKTAQSVDFIVRTIMGHNRITQDQREAVVSTGVLPILEELAGACSTNRRYYSAAPMRVAAASAVMFGEDRRFVFGQLKALNDLDFDAMSTASKALLRRVDNIGRMQMSNKRDVLCAGLKVFTLDRANLTVVKVVAAECDATIKRLRQQYQSRVGTVAVRLRNDAWRASA